MVAWPEAREPAAERLVAELQALPPGSLVPRDWILGRLTEPVPARDAPLPVTARDRLMHTGIRGYARIYAGEHTEGQALLASVLEQASSVDDPRQSRRCSPGG